MKKPLGNRLGRGVVCGVLMCLIFQVLFKKVIGDATYGQVAMFFSLIGLFNATMLWPLSLALYFTGVETLYWERLPWPALLTASILSLGNHNYIIKHSLRTMRVFCENVRD